MTQTRNLDHVPRIKPKPTLSQKSELHAALKRLHGKYWIAGMKPIYDQRGFASIMINRFDPSLAPIITQYPAIHWLELHVEVGNRPEAIRRMIPPLLDGCAMRLEYLEITNTLDVTRSTERIRDVLPEDAGPFGRLPSLREVVFNRVDVTDRIVKELCNNRSIESIDIREAGITKIAPNWPKLSEVSLSRLSWVIGCWVPSARWKQGHFADTFARSGENGVSPVWPRTTS